MAFTVDRIDIMNSLFGSEVVHLMSDGSTRSGRKPDGALVGPNGPRNRRVSAVLVATGLQPWTAASCTLSLCHNPFATQPLNSLPGPWTEHRALDDGTIAEAAPTMSLSDALQLPDPWPTGRPELLDR